MTDPVPPAVAERLAALRERPIEVTEKGFGSLRGQASVASLAAARPALTDAGVVFPLLTLRHGALEHNLASMAAYCARAGVALAPHGKTAMSPELAARQLAHGAWGITVATIGQLMTYRAFGFGRLLLANELTDAEGYRLAGRRAGRRPELRGVLLRGQRGGRGPARPGPAPAPGRAPAAGAGGDRPRRRAHRLPDR